MSVDDRRPRFAPPIPAEMAVPPPTPAAPRGTPGSGPFGVLAALAAVPLVCAPFLPWLTLRLSDDLFGGGAVREATLSGFRADGTGTVLAICGLLALALGGLALVLDRPAVQAGTAAAGAVALVCSLVFLLRVQEISGYFGNGTAYPSYGWYLGLASSLVVLGGGLAELSRKSPADAAASGPAASPWRP